jgi:hypothetical protein
MAGRDDITKSIQTYSYRVALARLEWGRLLVAFPVSEVE